MKSKIILIALILLSFAFVTSAVTAREDFQERGRYIYDEANQISLESELGLSAYLWKLDVKSGYETVVVFPKEKLTVEQMGDWFNQHGIGKEKEETGWCYSFFLTTRHME